MMNILVTGGAGFIGSHLAAALSADGHYVTVLDNLTSGKRENLEPHIRFIEGDICDLQTVLMAAADCDAIFHQAALVSVPYSIKEPQLNHAVNVTGAHNIFEAARQLGIKRVVYASSAAVYGDEEPLPKQEIHTPQLLTPYALGKYTNELYATLYNNLYGLECIGLRYMNVFGPRQDPSSPYSGVISLFCRAAINGSPVTIYGDGEQTRDFVYVADVVQANLKALKAEWSAVQAQPLFNVGRGEQTSLHQLLRYLADIWGQALNISYQPARPGDIRHSYADITHITQSLGYRSQVSISQGLAETVAWFRSH